MQAVLYRKLSFIGVVAIAAFFLPWIKACDKVESGFAFFMFDVFRRFELDTVHIFTIGILYLLVPVYTIACAFIAERKRPGTEPVYIKTAFAILLLFAFWMTANGTIGMTVDGAFQEIHTSVVRSIALITILALYILSVISIVIYLLKWRKQGFMIYWSEAVLLLSLVPLLALGIYYGAYIGLWIYFVVTISRLALAVYQARNPPLPL